MREITKQLKRARRELKLSQQDAATLIGVTRVTYNKWEHDPSVMPIGKYEQLQLEIARLRELKEK